ncbi:MAG TPA: D-alanyl-D-alanine carboxypeptidase [Desulfotomaculum sp.]|nr:D-alanyl-D-alanine carboxypeptidase [Desulfotomaculum sp.]
MRFLISLVTVLLTFLIFTDRGECAEPVISARAAVVMDLRTGQVLYAKEPTKRMYPASTTKILTAVVVLQNCKLDEQVEASKEAADVGGSAIWLEEGEELAVSDALYALLLNSANDVAVALAEKASGSVDGFVSLMNRTAKACGAVDSHFNNPHGLPDENHYTTALDLAKITRAAMRYKVFREIVATKTKTIGRESPEASGVLLNTNKLLWRYDGAIGVKTGYTAQAGQCLVAAARRGERELIAVILGNGGGEIWSEAARLLDWGFSAYRLVELAQPGEVVGHLPVAGGIRPVEVETKHSVWYNISTEEDPLPLPRQRLSLEPVEAPVSKGQRLGEIIFEDGNKEIGRVSVVAGIDVPRAPRWPVFLRALLVLAGTFMLLVLLAAINRRIRRRRKRIFAR